jgi:hypothetical protein
VPAGDCPFATLGKVASDEGGSIDCHVPAVCLQPGAVDGCGVGFVCAVTFGGHCVGVPGDETALPEDEDPPPLEDGDAVEDAAVDDDLDALDELDELDELDGDEDDVDEVWPLTLAALRLGSLLQPHALSTAQATKPSRKAPTRRRVPRPTASPRPSYIAMNGAFPDRENNRRIPRPRTTIPVRGRRGQRLSFGKAALGARSSHTASGCNQRGTGTRGRPPVCPGQD